MKTSSSSSTTTTTTSNNNNNNNNSSTLVAWGIWLLAVLRTTNLKSLEFQCPLVGHTHGSLDRIFSRLIVSLRGQTYMTLTELDDVFSQGLKGFAIKWNHHESSYDWTYVRSLWDGIPAPQERQCTPFGLGPWDLGQVETIHANDHHNNRDRCNKRHCNYHVSPLLIHYCWWFHIFHHG